MIITCLLTTGCIKEDIEKYQLGNKAKDYFASKYDISKFQLKLDSNHFYTEGTRCWWSCGENFGTVKYKGKSYTIYYNMERNTFGDNYQYDQISSDLNNYLSKKFPYAKRIQVTMLEWDVYATPEKYSGDIEDYFKNKVPKNVVDNNLSTGVNIWIEATDENQARELNKKYRKELITELNSLGITYRISISKSERNDKTIAFYYYDYVNGGRKPAFDFIDRVDKNYKECYDQSIMFDGDQMVCINN